MNGASVVKSRVADTRQRPVRRWSTRHGRRETLLVKTAKRISRKKGEKNKQKERDRYCLYRADVQSSLSSRPLLSPLFQSRQKRKIK